MKRENIALIICATLALLHSASAASSTTGISLTDSLRKLAAPPTGLEPARLHMAIPGAGHRSSPQDILSERFNLECEARPLLVRSPRAAPFDTSTARSTSAARADGFDGTLVAATPPPEVRSLAPGDETNRIEHRMEIEWGKIESMGRPPLRGGFRDPDTIGTWPGLGYRLRGMWTWHGEARQTRPFSRTPHCAVNEFDWSSQYPGLVGGEEITGEVCVSAWQPGRYRVPPAGLCFDTLSLALGFHLEAADSGRSAAMRAPYPFTVTDTVAFRLPQGWKVVDPPPPVHLSRAGFHYQAESSLCDSTYRRITSVVVDSTRLADSPPGEWLRTLQQIRDAENMRAVIDTRGLPEAGPTKPRQR